MGTAKTTSPDRTFQSRITGYSIIFQRNSYVNIICFLNIYKQIMLFLALEESNAYIQHL